MIPFAIIICILNSYVITFIDIIQSDITHVFKHQSYLSVDNNFTIIFFIALNYNFMIKLIRGIINPCHTLSTILFLKTKS